MKLFKRLLVAPAALGLMAPVAVNADTAFSSTTTLSGEAVFTVGSADNLSTVAGEDQEEMYTQYAYTLNFDSSFSGSDNLHVGIEAGNASGPLSGVDSAIASEATSPNSLAVSSLYYSFPVGDIAITGGPIVESGDLTAATASNYSAGLVTRPLVYSDLDLVDITGPGIGLSYAPESGIVASAGFVSLDGTNSNIGVNSDDGDDVTILSLGWNGDSGFGAGLVYTSHDGEGSTARVGTDQLAEYTTLGAGVYWNSQDMPLGISLTWDSFENEETDVESDSLHVGVDYEVGPGTVSLAYQTVEVDDSNDDTDIDMWELAYSYNVNDNVTVTPAIFSAEADGSDGDGVMIETTFSF